MAKADCRTYLADLIGVMKTHWPENRYVNVVCHGHSVPAGYFATPRVDSLNAYPHLLFTELAARFPFAVVNVIVTGIGGENSESGAKRFKADVLSHRPDVVTIDYILHDRNLGLDKSEAAWRTMIEQALAAGSKVLLLTPHWDVKLLPGADESEARSRVDTARQTRDLAEEYGVGLVDRFAAFEQYIAQGGDLSDLLSWVNHPNRAGHELITREILRWFPGW